MRATGWWLALAAVAVVSGCIGEGDECSKNSQCPRGFVCGATAKICVRDAAPVVQIDAPSATLTQATHTLTATVTDDVEVVRAELSADDGATWVAMTVAGDRASGEVALPSGLDSRPFPVKVRALDGLNQSTEASAALTVDRVGPQLTVTPPGALGGAEATFSGAVTDGSGTVTSVTATLGDGDVPATLADGGWTVRLPLPNGIGGERTLTVRAVDGLGNAAQATAAITLDTIAPIFTADAGQIVGQGPGLVRFRSNEPVQQVEATWRDAGVTVTVVSPTDFSVTVAAAAGTTSEPLIVRGRDRLGNAGQSTLTIEADTVAPTFMLEPNQIIGPTPAPVRFTASKPMGTVTARWRDAGVMVTTASATEFSVMVGAGPATTTERLEVSGADVRGNPGQRGLVVDTDTDAPQFVWLAPDAGARLGGDGVSSVLLSGTAQDLRGVAGVQFDLRDDAGFRPASLDDGGAWSLTVPLPPDDSVARLVVAQFTDGVGNVGTSTVPVVVDTVPPSLSIDTPAPDVLLGGSQASLFMLSQSADPGGLVSVRLALGDAGVDASPWDGGWATTFGVPLIDYSEHELSAVARDTAGNTARRAQRLRIDRVAPALNVTAPTAGQRLNLATVAADGGGAIVQFTINDADPVGRVVRAVLGSADAGVVTSPWIVASSATDNGTGYTVRVSAADTAGNASSVTRSYTVDRVAPSVTATSPTHRTRNLANPTASVSFSEPVWGQDAGWTLNVAAGPGTWSVAHDRYDIANFPPYASVFATVAPLVDASGNPLVSRPSLEFHVRTAMPQRGALGITDVLQFDVTSDEDGIPVLAVVRGGGELTLRPMNRQTGDFATVAFQQNGFPVGDAGLELQAYRRLDGVVPTNYQGLSFFDGVDHRYVVLTDGGLVTPTPQTATRLVLAPPQGNEPPTPYGTFLGADYRRGTGTRAAPYEPRLVTVGPSSAWYAFFPTGGGKIYYYRGIAVVGDQMRFYSSGQIDSMEPFWTEVTRYSLSAAGIENGRCTVLTARADNGEKVAVAHETADPLCEPSCIAESKVAQGLWPEVGTFGDRILLARYVSSPAPAGIGLFLNGTGSGQCAAFQEITGPTERVPLASLNSRDPNGARAYRPVRIGPMPALIYLDPLAHLQIAYGRPP